MERMPIDFPHFLLGSAVAQKSITLLDMKRTFGIHPKIMNI